MLIYKCKFNNVIIFNPEILDGCSLLPAVISTFVFLSGFFLLFLIPGCIFLFHFKNAKNDLPVFMGLSFIISTASLIALTTLFKIIWQHTLDRAIILVIICLFVFIGLISLWFRSQSNLRTIHFQTYRNRLISSVTLVLIVIIFSAAFHEKIISKELPKYDYKEGKILSIPLGGQADDLETFGLADSLRRHLLPYWDLEYADRFGFVFTDPPLSPFVSMFSILLFGENITSIALTSIGFITILFLVILTQSNKKIIYPRFLLCFLFFSTYFYLFRNSEYLFIPQNHFFSFLVIASYGYLLRRNYKMTLGFATTAILTRYYGIFFTFIGFVTLALFFKERRFEFKHILLKYCLVAAGLIVFIVIVGIMTGDLPVYYKSILVEHFARLDHFSFLSKRFPEAVVFHPSFSFSKGLQFLSWCLYSTAFTFPLLFLFGKNREENFYSFVGVVYFVLVFFSRYQLIKYVIPLIPFTAIVVSNKLERWISK